MNIKVRKYIYDYLLNSDCPYIKLLEIRIIENNKLTIFSMEIEDIDILDNIRDWAIDRQMFIGFDSDYNLTKEGLLLQEIIDIFYRE